MPQDVSPFSEQSKTLERLRDEMEQAKVLYDAATKAYSQARKQSIDPSAKGLACAIILHDFTQENFRSALQRFTAFVMTGELPQRPSAKI